MFGATFGCTTKAQKDGNIQAGFDSDAAAKYRSVAQGAYTQQMQAKVHGAAYRQPGFQQTQGSGSVPMDFEAAKRAAEGKRQENFELNARRFYGEDGFRNSQYKQSSQAFWGV